LCFVVIPLKKFQRYLAVRTEAFSAFSCSSLDKLSKSFSHSARWCTSADLWASKNCNPSLEFTP